eukprot:1194326-Rhodomonas_salina.1
MPLALFIDGPAWPVAHRDGPAPPRPSLNSTGTASNGPAIIPRRRRRNRGQTCPPQAGRCAPTVARGAHTGRSPARFKVQVPIL